MRPRLPLLLASVTVASTVAALVHANQPGHGSITRGVVAGDGYYQSAVVCIDSNNNARCDSHEQTDRTDTQGRFTLNGRGPVVAEISAGKTRLNSSSSRSSNLVKQDLVFRAPEDANDVVSALSTEVTEIDDVERGGFASALETLAHRVGVKPSKLLEDFNSERDNNVHDVLANETALVDLRIADALDDADGHGHDKLEDTLRNRLALDEIQNIVVIYAENRSFDNLFGAFPGANGLHTNGARSIKQVDRDGKTVLPVLPPAWGGFTAAGQTPIVTQAQTTNVWPNAPFQIDSPNSAGLYGYTPVSNTIITRDLYHRFFENIMQIDGGKSDQYVAWGDSGGIVMGYFDGDKTALWDLAHRYTLADNFFQGAYGGSFLNHQYLICACAPTASAAFVANNKPSINVLGASVHGVPQLAANPTQPASALVGPTSLKSGNIAPLDYFGTGDGYRAVNTMQPAYQPSGNAPADANGNDTLYANPTSGTTLEPQTQAHIGNLLSAKGINWAWYAGGWAAAAANPWNGTGATATSSTVYKANTFGTADATNLDFQSHHQPFNYYADLDPVAHAQARAEHLKDRSDLLDDIAKGTLPAVTFYKPVGFQNEHPGYASLSEGDSEVLNIVNRLRQSPQWKHMLVVVTYDEFGGQFDHVAPPKGDLIGPGTRIPAVVISPFSKKGYVDHTQQDTASILRFITHRYSLTPLPGLEQRDQALLAHGQQRMGYLGGALEVPADFGHRGHDWKDSW
jgi:acid phosphatase